MADSKYRGVPYRRERIGRTASIERARAFLAMAEERRSIRHFSSDAIPEEVIDLAIAAANSAPSGANMQPWKFVVVRDAETKRRIRIAAEDEEKKSYEGRMTEEWLHALAPLGTGWQKPFLEIAPVLIVVFKEDFHEENGRKVHHYYVNESVGIACGLLLAALNDAGLATLTHTPSPMGFLREILERPKNEKAYLLIPAGYPSADCEVPAITKKPLDEIRVDFSRKNS